MSRDVKPRKTPARPPARSGGGVVVGIFIGLVLGALIAAAAAWYFTRSTPFQTPPPAPRIPAVDEQHPAPLPGKPGDRPVVKQDFQFYKMLPEGDNAPAAAVATPVPSAVPAVVEPAVAKPAERIYLQVGAFADPAEADNLKAKLALAGIEANTQRGQSNDGRTVHRVRVGPFGQSADVNAARTRLSEAGFPTAVVKANP